MHIFEFIDEKKATTLDLSIPKTDLKMLKRIAIRERSDGVSPILRAILRSFLYEYRRLEAQGDRLPDGWISHRPSDAATLVRVKVVLPDGEAKEVDRITKIESDLSGQRLTYAALCRAILRAFVIAQERAHAANRPIDSSDLFRVSA